MPETAVVTLLFCDTVRSTELLSTLGDDANDEVRRKVLSALGAAVTSHRGVIVKSMGDGVMAAFRSSTADALSCAVEMHRAVTAIEHEGTALDLQLRIGVSFGEAASEGGDWFGTPVVEAARLEQAARPGQILATEVVRSIVGTRGGFRFREGGRRQLKGFNRPVAVVEVPWRDAEAPRRGRLATRPRRTARRYVVGTAASLVAVAVFASVAVLVARDNEDGGGATSPGTRLTSPGYQPVLEPRDCPPDVAGVETGLRCSDLIVPEDRAEPAGRQVRLLISVVPAKPGAHGVPTLSIGDYEFVSAAIPEYGDSVTMAIRGEQHSAPSLTCPEMSDAWRTGLRLPANGAEANALVLDAAERCGLRLEREGNDLDAYGRNDVLDDIRDLAIAMGWNRINVQAALTHVSTAILFNARYPGLVRAMVLVEPFPPGFGVFDEGIRHYHDALQAYYDACAETEACTRAFPELRSALPEAHEQLEQQPVRVTAVDPLTGLDLDVLIDGDRLVVAAVRAVGDQSALPVLAAALQSDDASSFDATAAYLVQTSGLAPDNPWGAWNSQYCEDTDRIVSRAGVSAGETAYPLFRVFANEPILALCRRWPTQSAEEPAYPEPSDVPALILTGELNPYAPPAFAEETARSFDNAQVGVFPFLTGGVIIDGPPCVGELRLEFLRELESVDIGGCIAQVPPIAFAGT